MSNEAMKTAVSLHQEQIIKLGEIMLNAFTSFGEIALAFQESYQRMFLEIATKVEPFIKRLDQLREFGWDDEYKEIVQRCGKLGWSFVGDMEPGEPRNLIGMTDRQIDRYFYSIFLDPQSNYLNTVFGRISEKCTCANPNSLKEAIQSFRARRYNATETLLFSIMDCLLMEITEANNANHWKITEKYKEYVSEKDMVGEDGNTHFLYPTQNHKAAVLSITKGQLVIHMLYLYSRLEPSRNLPAFFC